MRNQKITAVALLMGVSLAEVAELQEKTEEGLLNEEEALMEVAIDAGAEDVLQNEDGSYEITTAWEEISSVNDVLVSAGYTLVTSEVTMQAETTVSLAQEAAESMLKFLDALEEIDDVQKVYSNAEISADVLMSLNEY